MEKIEILKRVTSKIEFFIVASYGEPTVTFPQLNKLIQDVRPDMAPENKNYVSIGKYLGIGSSKESKQILFEEIGNTYPKEFKLTKDGEIRYGVICDNVMYEIDDEEIESDDLIEDLDSVEDSGVIKIDYFYAFPPKNENGIFKGILKLGKANVISNRLDSIRASSRTSEADQVYKFFNPSDEPLLKVETNGFALQLEQAIHKILFSCNLGTKQGYGRKTEFYMVDINTVIECVEFVKKMNPDIEIKIID